MSATRASACRLVAGLSVRRFVQRLPRLTCSALVASMQAARWWASARGSAACVASMSSAVGASVIRAIARSRARIPPDGSIWQPIAPRSYKCLASRVWLPLARIERACTRVPPAARRRMPGLPHECTRCSNFATRCRTRSRRWPRQACIACGGSIRRSIAPPSTKCFALRVWILLTHNARARTRVPPAARLRMPGLPQECTPFLKFRHTP